MDFDKILFMHWYILSMLWLIHIIFPNFSTELWPLIDFWIMFMCNILLNNWWIWSNLVDMYFDIFYAKTCAKTKISTVAGYHVVLATLLLYHINVFNGDDKILQVKKIVFFSRNDIWKRVSFLHFFFPPEFRQLRQALTWGVFAEETKV